MRVFLRRSRFGGFVTALVYVPRDRYDTATRLRIQEILLTALGGVELEYHTLISEWNPDPVVLRDPSCPRRSASTGRRCGGGRHHQSGAELGR